MPALRRCIITWWNYDPTLLALRGGGCRFSRKKCYVTVECPLVTVCVTAPPWRVASVTCRVLRRSGRRWRRWSPTTRSCRRCFRAPCASLATPATLPSATQTTGKRRRRIIANPATIRPTSTHETPGDTAWQRSPGTSMRLVELFCHRQRRIFYNLFWKLTQETMIVSARDATEDKNW